MTKYQRTVHLLQPLFIRQQILTNVYKRLQTLTNDYKHLQTTINVCYPTNSKRVLHFRTMEIREPLKAGCIYHISTKSNGNDDLFRDARDYFYFQRKMDIRLTAAWEIIAYTLVPNEIHFVVKILKKKIDGEVVDHSTLLSHLLNGYVQHYNYRYNRSGNLLSRSFRRKSIKDDVELQQTISKVHNLAVAKKLVHSRREWIYSSYRKFTDTRFGIKHLIQLTSIFQDMITFERLHDACEFCLDQIMPKRKWIKLLTAQEIAFRIRHPLGVHRWARRKYEDAPS